MRPLVPWLPPLILAALVLVVFRELAFTGHILGRGDTFTYFYPYWTVRDQFLRAGQLPLWTPDIFMGAPLLANPQLGTLYPPNWLTVLLDAPNAIRVSILLHIAWATLGAWLLARRAAGLGSAGALVTAAGFGVGGYIGAHVEQINQLQGLAWFPWLFLLLHHALDPSRRTRYPRLYTLLLGGAMALQILSGHTQTVFISGVGMGLYVLASGRWRGLLPLATASLIALVLASPQLVPTYELVGQSSRSGGLTPNAALSFSLSPFIAGRGLLPSYDGKVFSEYIAYIGVTGLALASLSLFRPHTPGQFPVRRTWLVMALAGLFLAVGLYNPLNWLIVQLPGFDLFRVPARWLALYGLSAAVLAGLGVDALLTSNTRHWRRFALPVIVVGVLAGASLLAGRAPQEINGPAVPTLRTFAAWGAALVAALALMAAPRRYRIVLVPLVLVELIAASWVMPYNDLVPPQIWSAQRFSISQLLAYTQTDENGLTAAGIPPGRVLSISGLLFDPGDQATLSARYQAMGMTLLEERYSFVAAKLKETLSPNLPLAWGIASVDGYDGGLLPTRHYNTFMERVYPDGVEVPGDGRLRENLALEDCRGACVPGRSLLLMMDARYLITDKVFDVWHEDVNYDTAFTREWGTGIWSGTPDDFSMTGVYALYTCRDNNDCSPPAIQTEQGRREFEPVSYDDADSGLKLARLTFEDARSTCCLVFEGNAFIDLQAVSAVDGRTGSFIPVYETDNSWVSYERVLSSDIKLYAGNRSTRAVIASSFESVNTEPTALDDPTQAVIIGNVPDISLTAPGDITFIKYLPTEVELETTSGGVLLLYDSYYPGWTATVNGSLAPIYRANINFRAVSLPAGENHVMFGYSPYWLPGVFIFGSLTWATFGILVIIPWSKKT